MRKLRVGFGLLLLPGLLLSLAQPSEETPVIVLNELEYFSAPGFSFLPFHNNYQVGFQGGLQMIQHGERLLDSGDFFVVPRPRIDPPHRQAVRRLVNQESSTVTVVGRFPEWDFDYRLVCHTDGKHLYILLRLDRPIDWNRVEQAGFRIFLYPGAYFSKSFLGESQRGIFPRQYRGRAALLGASRILHVAPEDPLRRFTLARRDEGFLRLVDNRAESPQPWFSIEAVFAPGSDETEIALKLTPFLQRDWRRPPVLGVSQLGYHPDQAKRAVLELDPHDSLDSPVNLYRIEPRGKKLLKSSPARPWGRFLRYRYGVFDFSEVRAPGVYLLEYQDQRAGPFRIQEDVYQTAWRPTLAYFFPIQMCHVAVREGQRVWHGACHLDDALQAPVGIHHLDGYQQGEHETSFADNQHVPGLNRGGWHDAGDHDLPAGSIALTTLALALAQEEFQPDFDQTTIRGRTREVELHRPDGQPDLLQQVEVGVQALLASYRIAGHIFPGIVENNPRAYSHLGDPVNITDNLVHDPALKPEHETKERSGKFDDRWVFTNRNTGLQYEVAQSLAAASRVLRPYDLPLAQECLAAAEHLWEYEQQHPAVYPPNAYVPRDSGFRSQELAATAELLLTTDRARYRRHLLDLLPVLESITGVQFGEGPGWTLVRALSEVNSSRFRDTVLRLAEKWHTEVSQRAAANPYGVPYPWEISRPSLKVDPRTRGFVWGHGWALQLTALRQYYFYKRLPEIFDPEPLFAVVNFVLGVHPANNQSYVSGLGANSPLIAYGFNRADWSHIPGGVISGASLVKPDFMELKEFPFLWYQTEYVIHGGATFIFDALAAARLLESQASTRTHAIPGLN